MQLVNVLADYGIFGANPGVAGGAFVTESNSKRTPLSSKARPFKSCRDARQETTPTILIGVALVEQAVFSPSLLPMSGPVGPDCRDGVPPPQSPISPGVENMVIQGCSDKQENLYSDLESFKCGGLSRGRDKDFRRGDLWSSGLWQGTSRTPSPFGGLDDRWDGRTWSGSTRTPSPPNDGDVQSLASESASDIPDLTHADYVHPVKHTFIHYDIVSSLDENDMPPEKCLARSASAPSLLMQSEFFHLQARKTTKKGGPQKDRSHESGKCTPCAYFYRKADSCRLGADCKFCHLCPPEAMKQYKKVRMKEIRNKIFAERWERKQKKAAKEKAEKAKKEGKA